MAEQASDNTKSDYPVFDFITPSYRLTGRGKRISLKPFYWNGAEVADEVDKALKDVPPGLPVVGCIPFDTDAPAELYVPDEVTWGKGLEEDCEEQAATSTARAAGADTADVPTPISQHYKTSVTRALESIKEGQVEKVVLARTATINTPYQIDPGAVVEDLGKLNPHSYVYRSDLGHGTLLGATPELVLRSKNGELTSFPLAGSIPVRGVPENKRTALKEGLLSSKKDLAEHGLVVQQVAEIFNRYLEDTDVPVVPEIVETPVILHLGSKITGQLDTPMDTRANTVMKLLYELHPTPAVCGWPTSAARKVIGELEDFDRGMYSGLVGWIDANGNGEWALALRGGVVKGDAATLYAGAGIVAGSDPEHEHAETAAKFQTFARVIERQRLSNKS